MKSLHFLLGITCIASLTGCVSSAQVEPNSNLDRARQTLDSLYLNYSVDNSSLLRENYPFDEQHTVTYLASEEQANIPNQFSYLWPYSGTFSAVNALFEATHDKKYKKLLDSRALLWAFHPVTINGFIVSRTGVGVSLTFWQAALVLLAAVLVTGVLAVRIVERRLVKKRFLPPEEKTEAQRKNDRLLRTTALTLCAALALSAFTTARSSASATQGCSPRAWSSRTLTRSSVICESPSSQVLIRGTFLEGLTLAIRN